MSAIELPVTVSKRKQDGEEYYEGTVQISGVRPTKLVKKSDSTTRFSTRSAVTTSAKTLAKKLGFEGVTITEANAKSEAKSEAKAKVSGKFPFNS